MESKIQWETEIDAALRKARSEKSPLLWTSSIPAELAANRWMQLRIQTLEFRPISRTTPSLSAFLSIMKPWRKIRGQMTPTLILWTRRGRDHRTVGFLGPDELVPSLMLGRAKVDFDLDNFQGAIKTLEALLKNHPRAA